MGPAASTFPSTKEGTDAHHSPGVRRGPGLRDLVKPSGAPANTGGGGLWAIFRQKTSLILIYHLHKDHLQLNNSASMKH